MLDNFESEWAFGPADTHIFACLDIDASSLMTFIDDARTQASVTVTIDQLVGRAATWAIERQPATNAHFDDEKIVTHESVDLLFITQSLISDTFHGFRLEDATEKTVLEIARELEIREKQCRDYPDEVGNLRNRVSTRLLGAAQRVTKVLDQMSSGTGPMHGSALVMSVGLFGNRRTNAALSKSFQVPAVFEARDLVQRAVVVDDEVVIRPMLRLSATVDRRVIDRRAADDLMADLREYCASPWDFEPDVARSDAVLYPKKSSLVRDERGVAE